MSRQATSKNACLAAGIALLLVIFAAIARNWGEGSFTAHMVIHMAIVAMAAPLLAAGLSGSRADLTRHLPWLGPLLASLIELVIVWIWHVPAMRSATEAMPVLSLVEQATFLAGGLLLWLTCLGGAADGRTGRRPAGAIGLLFTSMHMTLLGVLLALSPRPLYGDGDVTCFGIALSGGTDQQAGGVVMLAVGAVAYLIGGVVLLSGVLRDEVSLNTEDARC